MGLRIIFSKIALQDLKEIYDYISRDSLYYARNEKKLIRAAIGKLKLNTLRGKKFEKSENDLIRELIFRNYRIIYEYTPGIKITILTIHHHARLISNNPAFDDDDQ